MGETLIHLEVRCTRDAPCLVREAVDDVLRGWAVREPARLIASELMTNAVRHSGAGPDELIAFEAVLAGGALVIAVTDPCLAGGEVHIRDDSISGGYGLRIVDRVARQWGSEHPGGRRVWAELSLSR